MFATALSRIGTWGGIVVALAAGTGTALAQEFPIKPVRLIIAQGPGGATDSYARLLGMKLGDALGQPFVIDYRAGANGIIGMEATAKAAPDGYTIGMGNAVNLAMNSAVYKKLPYDPLSDFAVVSLLGKSYYGLLVPKSSPANNVKEFVALARSKPGALNYGAGGAGTRVATELFATNAKITLHHVPYKTTAQAMTDLLAGRIDLLLEASGSVLAQLKGGNVKLLGMTNPTRISMYPDLPTLTEGGVDFDYSSWTAIVAPAGYPAAAQRRIASAMQRILAERDVIAQYHTYGLEPQYGTPEQVMGLLRSDMAIYKKLVQDLNIPQE